MNDTRCVIRWLTLAAVLSGSMVMAESAMARDDDASVRVLSSLSACRPVAAADARLACFERATSELEQAVNRKDVRIVDRADIRRTKRSLFGFTLPRIGLFGDDAGDKNEEFTTIETTIRNVRRVENDRVELQLAEGDAVWVTTDPVAFPPKPGASIRIRQGALGNYFINVGGTRYRGRRLR